MISRQLWTSVFKMAFSCANKLSSLRAIGDLIKDVKLWGHFIHWIPISVQERMPARSKVQFSGEVFCWSHWLDHLSDAFWGTSISLLVDCLELVARSTIEHHCAGNMEIRELMRSSASGRYYDEECVVPSKVNIHGCGSEMGILWERTNTVRIQMNWGWSAWVKALTNVCEVALMGWDRQQLILNS